MSKIESFKQYLEDFNKITDYKNPNCSSCDECCGAATMITLEEYNVLKKYTHTREGKQRIAKAIKRIEDYRSKGIIYMKCPFLKNKRCTIYSLRPSMCRDFHCSPNLNSADKTKYTDGLTISDLLKYE